MPLVPLWRILTCPCGHLSISLLIKLFPLFSTEEVGFNPNLHHRVPSAIFMGGSIASQGGISWTAIYKLQNMASLVHSVVFELAPLPSGDSVISAPQSNFPSNPHLPPPIASIKDKPLDMGLKDITDKDSWIKAKTAIDLCLRCAPFWPSPTSKALVTMPDNVVASAWWEELLYFYLKPPVRDSFVEASQFDGKGFEMIEYIDIDFMLWAVKHGTQDVCTVNKVHKYHGMCELVESVHTAVETQRRVFC